MLLLYTPLLKPWHVHPKEGRTGFKPYVWAWSGEWVRVARYESQSINEGGWAWDTAGSKKGWALFMGVRGQFGKGLGLQMRSGQHVWVRGQMGWASG